MSECVVATDLWTTVKRPQATINMMPIASYIWPSRLLDDRTQEQRDYDDAMAIVNAIAPGWKE